MSKRIQKAVSQAGVAMLTVMFILVLTSTLAVYLIEDSNLNIRRVMNQRDSEQGYQWAVYSEQWAMKVLEQDARDNEYDHLEEDWNTLKPSINEKEQAVLSTEIEDLQGRFNLNNLTTKEDLIWYPAFKRLLLVLEIDEDLADAVLDWIDSDQTVSGHSGAEDPEYLLKDPPYRSANTMIANVGELIWIQGIDLDILQKLSPHVTALPISDAKININTASKEVLRILVKDQDEVEAELIIEGRGEEGYNDMEDVAELSQFSGPEGQPIFDSLVAIDSEYFEVYSRVEYGRLITSLYSVIERKSDTKQSRLIQRRRGMS